jgi:hypothetical protein
MGNSKFQITNSKNHKVNPNIKKPEFETILEKPTHKNLKPKTSTSQKTT